MYVVAKDLKIILFDNRIMPIVKPTTVAAIIPKTATKKVLAIPIR